MRTITTIAYKFSELSEEAQERAHRDYLNEPREYFWQDEAIDSLTHFLDAFDLQTGREYTDIRTGHIDDTILELSGQRLRTYFLNNYSHILYERKPQGKYPYKRRSRIQIIETCCPFTGYCMDETLLQPIRDFITKPDGQTYEDILIECVNQWEKEVESDREYQDSMEAFRETAEATEWEFTENGKML